MDQHVDVQLGPGEGLELGAHRAGVQADVDVVMLPEVPGALGPLIEPHLVL